MLQKLQQEKEEILLKKEKKNVKNKEVSKPKEISSNNNYKAGYDKLKIYPSDNEEYSFEELRANLNKYKIQEINKSMKEDEIIRFDKNEKKDEIIIFKNENDENFAHKKLNAENNLFNKKKIIQPINNKEPLKELKRKRNNTFFGINVDPMNTGEITNLSNLSKKINNLSCIKKKESTIHTKNAEKEIFEMFNSSFLDEDLTNENFFNTSKLNDSVLSNQDSKPVRNITHQM